MKNSGKALKGEFNSKLNFRRILKGILFSYIITIPILLILSIILSYTDFPEKYISTCVLLTSILSIFISSVIITVGLENKSLINGAALGFLYMFTLFLLSSIILSDFSINRYVITMMIIGILVGAIGGIIGINHKRSSKARIKVKRR